MNAVFLIIVMKTCGLTVAFHTVTNMLQALRSLIRLNWIVWRRTILIRVINCFTWPLILKINIAAPQRRSFLAIR